MASLTKYPDCRAGCGRVAEQTPRTLDPWRARRLKGIVLPSRSSRREESLATSYYGVLTVRALFGNDAIERAFDA